jgi:hypothetical protein
MGNVNCSELCGPGARKGLDLDANEIDGTPMKPAEIAVEHEEPQVFKKSAVTTKPKVNTELFAKKIASIDNKFSHIKYRRIIKRWKVAIASNKTNVHDPDLDERLKKIGNFVTDDEMRKQTKDTVLILEKQLGPLADIESKAIQAKTVYTKGPFKYNSDRSIYKGSWSQDLKRHGLGILVKEDGSKYEGSWENDEQSGYGRYYDNKGNYFVGK